MMHSPIYQTNTGLNKATLKTKEVSGRQVALFNLTLNVSSYIRYNCPN
jgi:hypothetical protein